MQNAWFPNPRHPDSDPEIIRKKKHENKHRTYTFFRSRSTRQTFKIGVPTSFLILLHYGADPYIHKKLIKIQAWNSTCPFLCSQCPRIVPGSLGKPKWRRQARQMTCFGTRNLRYVCKNAKNPAFRSQPIFQQRHLIKQKPRNENPTNQ